MDLTGFIESLRWRILLWFSVIFKDQVKLKSHREIGGSGASYRWQSAGTDGPTGTSAPNGPSGSCKSRDSH